MFESTVALSFRTMRHFLALAVSMLIALSVDSSASEPSPFLGGKNLSLVTDAETGCEYIQSDNGVLYPRKALDGISHKGCKGLMIIREGMTSCIMKLPDGKKPDAGRFGAGYTHEVLPGTTLSEGCF